MARWADVVNGKVINIFEADSVEVAEAIAIGTVTSRFCNIGDIYNAEQDLFISPTEDIIQIGPLSITVSPTEGTSEITAEIAE